MTESETPRMNVVNLLKDLAHVKYCCVIIVTHDPAIAGQADIVLRMRDGEIALDT